MVRKGYYFYYTIDIIIIITEKKYKLYYFFLFITKTGDSGLGIRRFRNGFIREEDERTGVDHQI